MFSAARPAPAGAMRLLNGPSVSWLRSSFAAIARAWSIAMRSRVASRTTRTSPCLRRKLEISSAGDSARAGVPASTRRPAITMPTIRCVIVPQIIIAHQTSAPPGRFSAANVDASRRGSALARRQVRFKIEAVTQVLALLQNVLQEGAVLVVLHHRLDQVEL